MTSPLRLVLELYHFAIGCSRHPTPASRLLQLGSLDKALCIHNLVHKAFKHSQSKALNYTIICYVTFDAFIKVPLVPGHMEHSKEC